MEFKLIRADKDSKDKDSMLFKALFALLILFPCSYFLLSNGANHILIVIFFLLLFFIGYPVFRSFLGDWVREKDIIGVIRFEEEQVKIVSGHETILRYQDWSNVLFKFNYVKGEPAFARDILHNGIACISINTKSGEVVNYKFLIEKKNQLADLKAILSRWYKSGIKVQERFANHEVKCILLNIQPSYAQIQVLKDELGVESFE
jgi:hypothetical protein